MAATAGPGAAPTPAPVAALPPATRSRAGCMTCRARKVKCSGPAAGSDGPCGRCDRLGLQCVSSNNGSLSQIDRAEVSQTVARRHGLNQAGFVRLRAAASCHFCRSRRQKCSGERPTCARCLRGGRSCVYTRRTGASDAGGSRSISVDSSIDAVPGAPPQPLEGEPGSRANDPRTHQEAQACSLDLERNKQHGREGYQGPESSACGNIPHGEDNHRDTARTRAMDHGSGDQLEDNDGSDTGICSQRRMHDPGDRDNGQASHANSKKQNTAQGRDRADDAGRGGVASHPLSPSPTTTAGSHASFRELDKSVPWSLVETFFSEIAPLRCLGFLHEPSFMQRLDGLLEKSEDPLLMAVCAVATHGAGHAALRPQGAAWAHAALQMVLIHMDRISVNMLMCVVLLHEHYARCDELRLCFMLSSLACRICQALQLNVEYDLDLDCLTSALSCTEKETRRRLMWACYTIDANTACGVEQLKLIREQDVKIQLPADEGAFFYRTAGRTSFLQPVGQLIVATEHTPVPTTSVRGGAGSPSAATQTLRPPRPLGGYCAYYVQLIVTRERVLRYLKRYRQEGRSGDPMTEFNLLAADLEAWRAALPPSLQLNPEVVYIRKKGERLSALLDLHAWYHQVWLDLYRALQPGLQMPPRRHSALTATAPPDFLERGRRLAFEHACDMARLCGLALEHAPESLGEPAGAICAYTTIRVKLHHQMHILTPEERRDQAGAVNDMIAIELRYLRALHERHPMVARTLACAEELVRSATTTGIAHIPAPGHVSPSAPGGGGEDVSPHAMSGHGSDTSPPINETDMELPNSPNTQISADYQLHPLSTFRIIRNEISERHAPERMPRTALPPLSQDVSFVVPPAAFPADPYAQSGEQMQQPMHATMPFTGGGSFVAPWELDEMSLAWISTANAPPDVDYGMMTWMGSTFMPY